MSNYEDEIIRRLRSNAHTLRAFGQQSGIQAELDFAELLERAANLIETKTGDTHAANQAAH
jgi:hypothetical protein